MKNTVIALTAAAALAIGTTAAPKPAQADISAWWLLPAFVGGVVVGSTFHRTHGPRAYAPYAYEPRAFGPTARAQAHYYVAPRTPRAQAAPMQAPRAQAFAGAAIDAPMTWRHARAEARAAQGECQVSYVPGLFGGLRLTEVC